MKTYKYIGGGAFFVLVLLTGITFISAVEANYECSGIITKNGVSGEVTQINLQLVTYQSLQKVWRDSDGKISFGGSPETMDSYSNISINNNVVSINSNEDSELGSGIAYGTFSTITNKISFYIDNEGEFEGTCTYAN